MHFQQEDSHRHKGLRHDLIKLLRSKGIKDENVLSAMDAVPRHFFLDPALDKFAYEDRAFPIDAEQTISQPYTVAYMTTLLEIKEYDKILEVGTGSGYQAAVLASLKAQVYSIERQKTLFNKNKKFDYFKSFRNIKSFYGDGFKGLPNHAPFHAIIITAAAPEIPQALLDQLRIGGRMVIPYGQSGEGQAQKMLRITKQEDGSFIQEEFDSFTFVPMLRGKAK